MHVGDETSSWGQNETCDFFLMGVVRQEKYGRSSGNKNCHDSGCGQCHSFSMGIPGLVNVYKKLWKDPPFFMGKSTISMGHFP